MKYFIGAIMATNAKRAPTTRVLFGTLKFIRYKTARRAPSSMIKSPTSGYANKRLASRSYSQ